MNATPKASPSRTPSTPAIPLKPPDRKSPCRPGGEGARERKVAPAPGRLCPPRRRTSASHTAIPNTRRPASSMQNGSASANGEPRGCACVCPRAPHPAFACALRPRILRARVWTARRQQSTGPPRSTRHRYGHTTSIGPRRKQPCTSRARRCCHTSARQNPRPAPPPKARERRRPAAPRQRQPPSQLPPRKQPATAQPAIHPSASQHQHASKQASD